MEIWEANKAYTLLSRYVDWYTRTSFKSFKLEGLENIPSDGPVILAPNHCNTLLDALVVRLACKSAVAFGARADIFRNKKIASLLAFCRIVPLARQRDSISEMKENLHTFDRIVECIDRGVPFCIFVEGRHCAERGMLPVKKGIFRIADQCLAQTGREATIVPVGLAYESFFSYMPDITVRFGRPLRLSEHSEECYTELLRERILELIKDYPVSRPLPCWLKIALAFALIPLFALSLAAALPVVVASAVLIARLKDKAWSNTVRFGCRFVLTPPLALAWGIAGFLLLPWWAACVLILLVVFAPSLYYLTLNFYKTLIK